MGPTRDDMVLRGVSLDRLTDRRSLMRHFDQFRREADATRMMDGMDHFTDQAMGLLTSSRLAEALDLSREDPRTVARYGTGNPKIFIDDNGAPRVPQSLLLARRLIEAGARVVTLNYSKWDWHGIPYGTIFSREAEDFPVFDQCLSALLDDLHQRGLDQDCTVVVWGEFGRTPKISPNVGRDHWPNANFALLAGGGMKTGQVIGATDRIGGGGGHAARDVRRGLRDSLPQLGNRPGPGHPAGSQRPSPIPGRRPRQAAARAGLILESAFGRESVERRRESHKSRPLKVRHAAQGSCEQTSRCRSRRQSEASFADLGGQSD